MWRANGPEQTVFGDHWDQLFNQKQKQNQRNRSQDQVVQLKQKGQFHWFGIKSSQQKLAPENDNVIHNDDTNGLVPVGQESLVVDKGKVFCWVSGDTFKCFREQWPQVQTKRSLDAWVAVFDHPRFNGVGENRLNGIHCWLLAFPI